MKLIGSDINVGRKALVRTRKLESLHCEASGKLTLVEYTTYESGVMDVKLIGSDIDVGREVLDRTRELKSFHCEASGKRYPRGSHHQSERSQECEN